MYNIFELHEYTDVCVCVYYDGFWWDDDEETAWTWLGSSKKEKAQEEEGKNEK